MAYVVSLLRLIPHLDHPCARVVVVTQKDAYAKCLFDNLRGRARDGVAPWATAEFKINAQYITLENGASLHFRGIEYDDPESKWGMCGLQCTYFFYSKDLDPAAIDFLRYRLRGVGYDVDRMGHEQLEEWRDNPLEQPKESDDKAVL